MSLESSKNLGGVGAILMLIGVLPVISSYTFGIIALVGLILVLFALYRFANIYNEQGIFSNALYGVIVGIVGAAVAAVTFIALILPNVSSFLMKLYPSWNGDWSTLSSLSSMTPDTTAINVSDVVPFIAGILVVLVIGYVVAIISAFLFRRSFRLLSVKSTVGLFSTAGLLLLIGAVLLILVIIPGLIVMWIALLVLAIAFFQMKPVTPAPVVTTASPPPPTPV